MADGAAVAEGCKLWYWSSPTINIKGRGEYIRLIFEEAGVPYIEPAQEAGPDNADGSTVVSFCWGGGNPDYPVRCPPAIQRGSFTLCNTAAVACYLGRKFQLVPTTGEEDCVHCESILAIVADAVGEGRLAFHPTNHYATHKGQEETSVPHIVRYGETRLPKYLAYFEEVLSKNPHGPEWLVGDKLTVADLHVYHYVCAAEHMRRGSSSLASASAIPSNPG
ncbi:hypothetical protein FOA52_000141 [Chlamydomonas sp. UWO 241]|nr:hypothetical protein FOA52_000141 [Chlamydomonas sp. UWO 241]